MTKQDVLKSKTYRDMEEHYKRVCREKRVVELELQAANMLNDILRASHEERRRLMAHWRLA